MSSDDLSTQPMLNAILERINELDAKFTHQLNELDAKFTRELEAIRGEVVAIRSEMAAQNAILDKHFRSIEKRLDVISSDLIKLRADIRDMDERVERLELKPA